MAQQHLSPEATLFLVALDDDDPEKRSALEHARTCASCQRLLRQSEQMLELIDHDVAQLPAIATQLEAQIGAAVAVEQARSKRRARWRTAAAWVVGAAVSALLAWNDATEHATSSQLLGGRGCLMDEQVFGLFAFAAGALWAKGAARRYGPASASVAAMSGAFIGQVWLRTHCQTPHAALHLLTFHVLGVVVAAALGAAAGQVLVLTRRTGRA
jgi:hypothetical protein